MQEKANELFTMIVMGIETSCDETAIGIVNSDHQILANALYSQTKEHLATGGVVPEIAARAHVQTIQPMIHAALKQSGLTWSDIDGIAAVTGPGLIGGVMVGMMAGKAIAAALHKPFLAVNHLQGHVLTARLTDRVPFPYLTLLISGGHTQLLIAHGLNDYTLLGESIDDAAGEAFDKSAKMMGLTYPGGPLIEKYAGECADTAAACARFPLPRPLTGRPGSDFSFAGLKTAVRQTIDKLPGGPIDAVTRADICTSLQTAIGDVLCDRLKNAGAAARDAGCKHFVLAGGVAANLYLRTRLTETARAFGMTLVAPPVKLCTDNGVMIAWAGLEQLSAGQISDLNIPARPRWPLMDLKAHLKETA